MGCVLFCCVACVSLVLSSSPCFLSRLFPFRVSSSPQLRQRHEPIGTTTKQTTRTIQSTQSDVEYSHTPLACQDVLCPSLRVLVGFVPLLRVSVASHTRHSEVYRTSHTDRRDTQHTRRQQKRGTKKKKKGKYRWNERKRRAPNRPVGVSV